MTLRKMITKLQEKWSGRIGSRRVPQLKSRRTLELEQLESRDLMSVAPTIFKVTPPNQGSLTQPASGLNKIVVQYSEPMDATPGGAKSADNAANYALFGPNNTPITITSVNPDPSSPTTTFDISFANGQVAGAYTLLVKGDQVYEASDTVALAQPGQLVVANGTPGASSVSTINAVTGNPILNALQTYPMGAGSSTTTTNPTTPTPTAVVVADFNGDGVADLAVANSLISGSEIDIYQGKAGGGFDATPDARLLLPGFFNGTAALIAFNPTGAVATTGFADLAVLDPQNATIDVFTNSNLTAGSAITNSSFAGGASYLTGAVTPKGLAAGNFNNDAVGDTDLAVVDSSAGANFTVDFLAGNGDGTFGPVTAVTEPDPAAPNGIGTPSSLAAGGLKSANSADLAIGGSDGVETLINNGTANTFAFTPGTVINSSTTGAPAGLLNSVSSVAIGNLNGTGNDIVASSSTSNTVEILDNVAGTIVAANSVTESLGAAGFLGNAVKLSTNASGLADIVTLNTNTNTVTVLQNTSTPTTFSFKAPAHYTVDNAPIAIAIGAVEGDANPDVITANTGIGGAGNEGGTFSILRNNPASVGTYLVSTPLMAATNTEPDAVAVGDLNGDGVPDLVVANLNTNSVTVYLASAPGVYPPTMTTTYTITDGKGNGHSPVSVTLARLTANGPLDIITADQDGFVSVLANNGAGAFTAPVVTFAVGSNPTQVVAGNFDGTGNISLAVSHSGFGASVNARGVTLLIGNGNRTFQAGQEILPNIQATALVAGNFTTTTAGAALDLVVADADPSAPGVFLLQNNGKGVFTQLGNEIAVGPNPSALVAADFNGDGLLDVAAVSNDTTGGSQQIAVLLNSAGDGFAPATFTALPFNFAINSVAVTDINLDGSRDLVVGLSGAPVGGGISDDAPADANFYVLTGNGDGTFSNPVPYMAGGAAYNTVVAVVSDPLVRVTTFNLVSDIVIADLVQNDGFEGKDLSRAQANLLGWQTAKAGVKTLGASNSRGGWYTQTGTESPLSLTTVPAPTPYVQPISNANVPASGVTIPPFAALPDPNVNTGQSLYRAMLDQSNLVPLGGVGANQADNAASYAGSNFLYQDVTLPSDPTANKLVFSISLYIQSLSGFTSSATSLDYDNGSNDQQVRVDIMSTSQPIDSTSVILPIFETTSSDPNTMNFTMSVDVSSLLATFAGQTVRIRIAAVNNTGPLIVGVDNVSLQSEFIDVVKPTFPGQPTLRNPGYVVNAAGLTSTTDPTIIGQVADNGLNSVTHIPNLGNVNNIAYVAFSPTNDGTFNQPGDFRISALSLDATGKFSVTLPDPVLGLNTVGVEVVDKAGNVTLATPVQFIYQGPSTTNWQAIGPGAISTGDTGNVQYTTVSGRINTVLTDPQDPSGDTYLIGSDNGGVWKTTDGGADWTPATDYLSNKGLPINVPIGALAGAVDVNGGNGNAATNRFFVYAGTGDSDTAPDSRNGSGILLSTDGGNTFQIAGNSDVVLAGARISKIVVDPKDVYIAYAAVVSGGEFGPGVYRTLDGGQTWAPILTPANMNLTGLGFPSGTTLASVTDIVMDPHDDNILTIGMGNIGLVGASATAGVWTTSNATQANPVNIVWSGVNVFDPNVQNDTLPGAQPTGALSGISLGRVTLAEAYGANADIATLYVLIARPPLSPAITGGSVNFGAAPNGVADDTPTAGPGGNENAAGVYGLYKNSGGSSSSNALGNHAWTHVMIRQFVSAGGLPNGGFYQNIEFTGADGSNSGALTVDATDPNVVYIGGSEEYPNDGGAYGLLRVDTGDMQDTTHFDASGAGQGFVNDGDDMLKRELGWNGTIHAFEYPSTQAYIGEGVSWLDISTSAFEGRFSRQFGGQQVPPNITSVAVDSQGRILLGTEQGIYRLTYEGTGYDFTSGGDPKSIVEQTAVVGPGNPKPTPPTSTIQLTSINGNLAIAELTSVAIDPSIPGRYYTTEYNTGAASITDGVNSGATQGLVGFGSARDGDSVLVGAPDPTSPPGTLNTVYEEFAFATKVNLIAFQPESSNQGGATGTFTTLNTSNVNQNDPAGYMPVFTDFPTKIATTVNGTTQFFDELLLATDRIYTTSTSGGVFTQVGNQGALEAGAVITAATFAPNNNQVIYAGTNKGEVFVTFTNGNFTLVDAGLPTLANNPKLTINSITVDPVNDMIAFVTLGGVSTPGSLIYMTANGGVSWTNITGNLPNVGANDLVFDPRSEPGAGAPNGHLYVATNVGVYVSVNGGTTWTVLGANQFGSTLPHVPVISLEFNSTLEELVAATQGRGVFQISTDVTGPHVVSVTPATPQNGLITPLTSVTVTFNEAIGSFPASQVTIIGPNGQTISEIGTPTNVSTVVLGVNPDNKWQITFAAQTADGDYTFKIGPKVLDLAGNPMDQNQNGINGEPTGDVFTFQVALNSTEDGAFVTGQYNDELGRPADTNGFISFLTPIDNALYAALPSTAFSYIATARAQVVEDLYGQTGPGDKSIIGVGDLFQRAATTGANSEVAFWLGHFQSGLSYEQMIVALTANQEYYAESRINGNDTKFVTAIYGDLLTHYNSPTRVPSAFELNLFVTQLFNAEIVSRNQDAIALLGGQPAETAFITNAYEVFMNRAPQPSDINFGLNLFASGGTDEQLIAAILGSQEFYTSVAPGEVQKVQGGTPTASNATLITAMYDLLFPGYTVSSGEVNFWVGQINNPSYNGGANSQGLSGQQIANALDTSSLYRFGINGSLPPSTNPDTAGPAYAQNRLVDNEYMAYLHRHATLDELNYWQGVYIANPNFRTEDLIANILASPEYFTDNTMARTPLPSQDQQWVQALYSDVPLVFPPGTTPADIMTAEQTRDLPFLANAEINARAAVGAAIVNSQEYRDNVTTYIYETDLGRAPSAFELALWRPIIGQSGVVNGLNGDEQVLDAVFSSREYYMDQPVNASFLHTNGAWLTSVYADLHIQFDPATQVMNLSNLDVSYAGARLNAIQGFQTTPEYYAHITIQAYTNYLGRAPSAAEITNWIGQFQSGVTQQQQIADILASQEYLNRSPLIIGQSVNATNTTFVEAAYLQLFPGYTITQSDKNTFIPPLNNGTITRLQVATTLVDSILYQFGAGNASNVSIPQDGFVERAYMQYLGRAVTQGELGYWLSVYNPNNPGNFTTTFLAALFDSPEYLEKTHLFP